MYKAFSKCIATSICVICVLEVAWTCQWVHIFSMQIQSEIGMCTAAIFVLVYFILYITGMLIFGFHDIKLIPELLFFFFICFLRLLDFVCLCSLIRIPFCCIEYVLQNTDP